jgi:hypothetical protein
MTAVGDAPATRFVAFISYAHQDEAFARRLESAIESHETVAPGAVMKVCRDRSDFTGGEYLRARDGSLAASAMLIVVCSPAARESVEVQKEIQAFAAKHGAERILPVIVGGLPDNEADAKKAFPPALLDVLKGVPLAADFRDWNRSRDGFADARFEPEWFKLLATLQDTTPDEVRARDKRRQVRAWRTRAAIVGSLAIAFLVASAVMFYLWQDARRERLRADTLAQQLKTNADKAETEVALADREKTEADTAQAPLTKAGRSGSQAQPPPPASPAALKPRVYLHIRDESQRAAAVTIQQRLEQAGYDVPSIQRLDVGPLSSELRYFFQNDRALAQTIAGAIAVPNLAVKQIGGYESSGKIRAQHFELWLAPPSQ